LLGKLGGGIRSVACRLEYNHRFGWRRRINVPAVT
jgi:hypothetical protein